MSNAATITANENMKHLFATMAGHAVTHLLNSAATRAWTLADATPLAVEAASEGWRDWVRSGEPITEAPKYVATHARRVVREAS